VSVTAACTDDNGEGARVGLQGHILKERLRVRRPLEINAFEGHGWAQGTRRDEHRQWLHFRGLEETAQTLEGQHSLSKTNVLDMRYRAIQHYTGDKEALEAHRSQYLSS
jgi:hypothetical protein